LDKRGKKKLAFEKSVSLFKSGMLERNTKFRTIPKKRESLFQRGLNEKMCNMPIMCCCTFESKAKRKEKGTGSKRS